MNFICPYCNRTTTITAPNKSFEAIPISTFQTEHGYISLRHLAIACPNRDCKKLSLSIELLQQKNSVDNYDFPEKGSILHAWPLLPQSKAKPQPEYIPHAIRDDYYEACSILTLSPKASATLSRRCLQGIVRDFWDIPKGRRGKLGAELSYVKEKIDPDTWDGIEAIRSVGDVGAHMEKNVNFVVDVEPEEAELLVKLIEMLFEDWYVIREKRKQRAEQAKALSQMKLAQKKTSESSFKNTDRRRMTPISQNKIFDGTQFVYGHSAKACDCDMRARVSGR